MKITVQDIYEAIKNNSDSGRHCQFIPINDSCGYKFYLREDLRDDSYNNQSLAAEYGLAPEVYEKINVGKYYGFITEKVDVADDWNDISHEDVSRIIDELQDVGIPAKDDYYKNFGFKNNEAIYIDFCCIEENNWELSNSVED